MFFFFNDTATTEIYTLSLHDALPISRGACGCYVRSHRGERTRYGRRRSEEHTSELQSQSNLVCRLLLEKKKKLTSPIISVVPSSVDDHAVRLAPLEHPLLKTDQVGPL